MGSGLAGAGGAVASTSSSPNPPRRSVSFGAGVGLGGALGVDAVTRGGVARTLLCRAGARGLDAPSSNSPASYSSNSRRDEVSRKDEPPPPE